MSLTFIVAIAAPIMAVVIITFKLFGSKEVDTSKDDKKDEPATTQKLKATDALIRLREGKTWKVLVVLAMLFGGVWWYAENGHGRVLWWHFESLDSREEVTIAVPVSIEPVKVEVPGAEGRYRVEFSKQEIYYSCALEKGWSPFQPWTVSDGDRTLLIGTGAREAKNGEAITVAKEIVWARWNLTPCGLKFEKPVVKDDQKFLMTLHPIKD